MKNDKTPSNTDSEWEKVGNREEADDLGEVQQHLVSFGLSSDDAAAVLAAAGIRSLQDLALLADDDTIAEVINEAQLKIVPTKKLSNAVKALTGEEKTEKDEEDTNKKRTDETTTIDKHSSVVDEYVVVCIDRSGSMGCGLDEPVAFGANAEKTLAKRSRMDAVKQCFYAFRDRTETLDDRCHCVGLIQFDNRIEQLLPLTDNLDRFEAAVDDMRQRGATAIYSAILSACQMLSLHADNEKADLRVLVLTDGQNNAGESPQTALKEVQKIGAVVDAILVGDSPDANLRKIVAASGGSCFPIRTLSDAFELMEAESVVSLKARRGGAERPPKQTQPEEVKWNEIPMQAITRASNLGSSTQAPPTGPLKLTTPEALIANMNPKPGTERRIHKELKDLAECKHPEKQNGVHIYPCVDDMYQMKALLEGPVGSPFEGGVFVLGIALPADYPFKPPKIHFETPIFHCNVNTSGGICLDILKDNWSAAFTICSCLYSIRQLIENPNSDDALRPTIAELTIAYEKCKGTDTRYIDEARKATRQDASKTIAEWHQLWGV